MCCGMPLWPHSKPARRRESHANPKAPSNAPRRAAETGKDTRGDPLGRLWPQGCPPGTRHHGAQHLHHGGAGRDRGTCPGRRARHWGRQGRAQRGRPPHAKDATALYGQPALSETAGKRPRNGRVPVTRDMGAAQWRARPPSPKAPLVRAVKVRATVAAKEVAGLHPGHLCRTARAWRGVRGAYPRRSPAVPARTPQAPAWGYLPAAPATHAGQADEDGLLREASARRRKVAGLSATLGAAAVAVMAALPFPHPPRPLARSRAPGPSPPRPAPRTF